MDECDTEKFGTLLIDSSEKKKIDGGHRRRNRKGYRKISKRFLR